MIDTRRLKNVVTFIQTTYHHSFDKQPIDVHYFRLAEENDTSHKAHKIEFGDIVRITRYKNIFSSIYTKNKSKEIFVVD